MTKKKVNIEDKWLISVEYLIRLSWRKILIYIYIIK